MKYRFETPDQFIAWLTTQSLGIQREAARVTLLLTDMGMPGQQAAHLVYEAIQTGLKMSPGTDIKH